MSQPAQNRKSPEEQSSFTYVTLFLFSLNDCDRVCSVAEDASHAISGAVGAFCAPPFGVGWGRYITSATFSTLKGAPRKQVVKSEL